VNLDQLYQDFKTKAQEVAAEVFRVKTPQDAVKYIADLFKDLQGRGIEVKSVWLRSPLVEGIDLEKSLGETGTVYFSDLARHARDAVVGISQVDLAVAETGSLGQNGEDVNQRLVSTLPSIHVALVPTVRLVESLDDALGAFAASLPGYISFITGPSRTADIERVLTIGVHGPERLIVLFVDEEGRVH